MNRKIPPSMDAWLREAKAQPGAARTGMYLIHNGVVRQSARASVRDGAQDTKRVRGMVFSYDGERLNAAIEDARRLPGIHHVRVWLNEGELDLGDDIMYVLVGGDIRPRVVEALNTLVGRIKAECVVEREIYEE